MSLRTTPPPSEFLGNLGCGVRSCPKGRNRVPVMSSEGYQDSVSLPPMPAKRKKKKLKGKEAKRG